MSKYVLYLPRAPYIAQRFEIKDIDTSRCYTGSRRTDGELDGYALELRLSHSLTVRYLPAGTMFELVKELKDGAEALKKQSLNSISLSAGTELFIEFVTLFPHDASVRACPTSFISL